MNNADINEALALMEAASQDLGPGILEVLTVLFVIFVLFWYILSSLGFFKMFKKAGMAAWTAFVPLFCDHTRYKLAWKSAMFWIFLVCTLVFEFFGSALNIIVKLIALIAGIISLVFKVKCDLYTAKAFGKSTLWGVLLFFFPFIVSLILGFGKAKYVGNPVKKAA